MIWLSFLESVSHISKQAVLLAYYAEWSTIQGVIMGVPAISKSRSTQGKANLKLQGWRDFSLNCPIQDQYTQ